MEIASVVPNLPDRYAVDREVDRGGMGVVWRVTDRHFDRPLAVKVMLATTAADSEAVARFQREARITGTLQHPAIPPVVDQGQLDDGSPFLSMKLIEGKTLSSLLKQRTSVQAELPRFLGIFEQVCQAVGYAHSRGIIHRDLKPANIMVGEFGEVQVMDWGLARQKDQPDLPTPPQVNSSTSSSDLQTADFEQATVVFSEDDSAATGQTDEPGESHTLTAGGQVMGTLAYMPPEQARGQIPQLDSTADVFALGGILCKILTGRAPYTGQDQLQLYRQALAGNLTQAFALLDRSQADPELIALAKRCLDPDPNCRPWDGHEVAERIRHYEQTTLKRLEQEKTERAAAEARAEEERKRRRLTIAAAGLVTTLLLLVGLGGWWYLGQQAAERARIAREETARELRKENARTDIRNALEQAPELWNRYQFAAAETLLDQAESRLEDLPRNDELVDAVQTARNDLEIVRKLDHIHQQESLSTRLDPTYAEYGLGNNGLYAQAFENYGIRISQGAPEELADQIRSSAISSQLLESLYLWKGREKDSIQLRLQDVVRAAETPERLALLQAVRESDEATNLRRIADLDFSQYSSGFIRTLETEFIRKNQFECASQLWNLFAAMHPDEYWVHMMLGSPINKRSIPEQIAHLQAAIAIRPDAIPAARNLAINLTEQKRFALAEHVLKHALSFEPSSSRLLTDLGSLYRDWERFDEAEEAYRRSIQLNRNFAGAHNMLGNLLMLTGRLEEAKRELKESLRLDAQNASAWTNFGLLHQEMEQYVEAEQAYRKAIELDPDLILAYKFFGSLLVELERTEEAEQVFAQMLRLKPDDADAHSQLGKAYRGLERYNQAESEYRRAIQIAPENSRYRYNLATLLMEQKQEFVEAEQQFRIAIRLDPGNVGAYQYLGLLLKAQQRYREAEKVFQDGIKLALENYSLHVFLAVMYQEIGQFVGAEKSLKAAIALAPEDHRVHLHLQLGVAYESQGRFQMAEEECRKSLRLDPAYVRAHTNLGNVLRRQKKFAEAEQSLRTAIQLNPLDARAHDNLGSVLVQLGRHQEAVEEYQAVVGLKDDGSDINEGLTNDFFAEAYRDLGNALAALNLNKQAEEALKTSLQVNPSDAFAYVSLGRLLTKLDRKMEAVNVYRDGIAGNPNSGVLHYHLGTQLESEGRLEDAASAYLKAVQLDPRVEVPRRRLGALLLKLDRFKEAEQQLTVAIELKPHNEIAHNLLAKVFEQQGRIFEAEREFRAAVACRPNAAPPHNNLALFLARQGRYQVAEEEFRVALQLNPKAIVARGNLARMLERLGRYQEAIEILQTVLKIQRRNKVALNQLGGIHVKQGQYSAAEQAYRAALEIDPQYRNVYSGLVVLKSCRGAVDDAEFAFQEFQQRIPAVPENASWYIGLANALQENEQDRMARKVYRMSIALLVNDAERKRDVVERMEELREKTEDSPAVAEKPALNGGPRAMENSMP